MDIATEVFDGRQLTGAQSSEAFIDYCACGRKTKRWCFNGDHKSRTHECPWAGAFMHYMFATQDHRENPRKIDPKEWCKDAAYFESMLVHQGKLLRADHEHCEAETESWLGTNVKVAEAPNKLYDFCINRHCGATLPSTNLNCNKIQTPKRSIETCLAMRDLISEAKPDLPEERISISKLCHTQVRVAQGADYAVQGFRNGVMGKGQNVTIPFPPDWLRALTNSRLVNTANLRFVNRHAVQKVDTNPPQMPAAKKGAAAMVSLLPVSLFALW
jgi:hypothetical protein